MSTDLHSQDDDFQKELVELFAQEAKEWLLQIHAAFGELHPQLDHVRYGKVIETITAAVTNLGGSAATVDLPDVERSTFALLPFVEAIRNPAAASDEDYLAAKQNLQHVARALRKATGVEIELEPESLSDAQPIAQTPAAFVQALQEMERSRPPASVPTRSFAQMVIRRVEQDVENGSNEIDVLSVHSLLIELNGSDEEFLRLLKQRMPRILEGLGRLKGDGRSSPTSPQDYAMILQDAQRLQEAAMRVQVTPLVAFFAGFQSFLTLVTQRRINVAAKRFDMIETRIKAIVTLAHQWAESGRAERAAISKLLPATP